MEKIDEKKWKWGVNRWIILGLIILSIGGSKLFSPVRPHIQLAAENITTTPLLSLPLVGDIYLTNTLIAMILVDVIILIIAISVKHTVKRAQEEGELIPKGFSGAIEAMFEALYNLTKSTAGSKWAKVIFPYFITITLMVLVSNWMELIPGVDSVGFLTAAEHGYQTQLLTSNIALLINEESMHGGFHIVPFIRVLSTDLNFTVALALISVCMTQIIGIRAQGVKYFTKYWNTKTLFTKPIFGVIDWGVGILEIVSEISKILSFSFRLFGNIFAGSVMLFVIGALVPVLAQSVFLGLEFFVGLIQALVFGMLTMVFMSQAVYGHDE